ncbi:TIM barrel protein [Verrucomicrobiota bacterium]
MNEEKTRILFVCTGNAGRSQIAQAFFGAMVGGSASVFSAGVDPWQDLHPVARRLLEERGVDTAKLHPKHVQSFADTTLDCVVTLGDRARAETPQVGGNPRRMHWDIADPADADGTGQEERVFRDTIAIIEDRLPHLLEAVEKGTHASSLHLAPGISTCVVRPSRVDPAVHLPAIAAAGFKCIELNCYLGSDDFPWDRPSRIAELSRIAADTGLRVYAVHAEGGLGSYRGKRSERFALDLCKCYADLAAELGAMVVTCHAGLPDMRSRREALRQLQSSIEELSRHVLGMPCRYGWENEPLGLSTAEHLEWIRELEPGTFGFVLDNGHSNIGGTTDLYLDSCKGLLCNLHLSDNSGNRDEHRIPGTGSCRWHNFAARLASAGYVGPMMLEIEARDRQDALPSVLAEARAAVSMIMRGGPTVPMEALPGA